MRDADLEARAALSQILGDLVDPKYTSDPVRAEAALRGALATVYKTNKVLLDHLPPFVQEYVAKWKAAKEKHSHR